MPFNDALYMAIKKAGLEDWFKKKLERSRNWSDQDRAYRGLPMEPDVYDFKYDRPTADEFEYDGSITPTKDKLDEFGNFLGDAHEAPDDFVQKKIDDAVQSGKLSKSPYDAALTAPDRNSPVEYDYSAMEHDINVLYNQDDSDAGIKIEIPGGYEGLKRIREQASKKFPGATQGIFASATDLGPDQTPEAMERAYQNIQKSNLDRQISLIERVPPQYRTPNMLHQLQSLYERKVNEGQVDVARERNLLDAATIPSEIAKNQGLAEYYGSSAEADRYKADAALQGHMVDAMSKSAGNAAGGYEKVIEAIGKESPAAAAAVQSILYRDNWTDDQKASAIEKILVKYGLTDDETLGFTGPDEFDQMIGLVE